MKNPELEEDEEKVDPINLPSPFAIGPPPEKDNHWNYNLDEHEEDANEIQELELIHQALLDMLAEGLTSDDLLQTWTERRVSPWQKRTHKMCYMSGAMDPHRMSTFELSKESVYRRVKAIARTNMKGADWTWGKEPYTRENPPPSVRTIMISPPKLHLRCYNSSLTC